MAPKSMTSADRPPNGLLNGLRFVLRYLWVRFSYPILHQQADHKSIAPIGIGSIGLK